VIARFNLKRSVDRAAATMMAERVELTEMYRAYGTITARVHKEREAFSQGTIFYFDKILAVKAKVGDAKSCVSIFQPPFMHCRLFLSSGKLTLRSARKDLPAEEETII